MSCFGVKHRTTSPFGILNSGELHKGDVCTESIWNHLTRKVPKWGGVGRKDQIPGIQFLVVLMLFCLICLLPKPSISWPSVLTHPRGFKTLWKKSGIPWTTTKLIDSGSDFLTFPNFPCIACPVPWLHHRRNWSRSVSSPRRRKRWGADRKTPFQIWISWDFLGICTYTYTIYYIIQYIQYIYIVIYLCIYIYVYIHTLYTILYIIYTVYIYIYCNIFIYIYVYIHTLYTILYNLYSIYIYIVIYLCIYMCIHTYTIYCII